MTQTTYLVTGRQGPSGTQGIQGIQGIQGATGTGLQGPPGSVGAQTWKTPPQQWATAQAYSALAPADTVVVNGNFYVCAINHTSGTFATDLAANKWTLAASAGSIIEPVNRVTTSTRAFANGDGYGAVVRAYAGAASDTLQQAGGSGNMVAGWWVDVINDGAGALTITPTVSTIDGLSSLVIPIQQGVRLFSDGTNYYALRGLAPSSSVVRGHLSGLALTVPGSTKTLTVAAGMCTDDGNSVYLTLSGSTALNAALTGAGGIDTGSPPISGTLHVFVIAQANGASPNVFCSTSLSPTLPTNYVYKRRIASLPTDASANFVQVIQDGDFFQFMAPVSDLDAVLGATTAQTKPLTSLPTGIRIQAELNIGLFDSVINSGVRVSDLSATDVAPTLFGSDCVVVVASSYAHALKHVWTNTSKQVRVRAMTTSAELSLQTRGWMDRRGRDA